MDNKNIIQWFVNILKHNLSYNDQKNTIVINIKWWKILIDHLIEEWKSFEVNISLWYMTINIT